MTFLDKHCRAARKQALVQTASKDRASAPAADAALQALETLDQVNARWLPTSRRAQVKRWEVRRVSLQIAGANRSWRVTL